jgi:Family of unknown function (DUF6174)
MNLRLLLASTVLFTSASSVPAQTVDTVARRPSAEILDSLQAGRKRWARAHVVEYQIQSHVDCFCVYRAEDVDRQLPLLTIKNRSITARAKGKPGTPPSRDATIEDLFTQVEDDARITGRVIDRLELDPVYGFPVWYRAHDPSIPDDWLQLVVDSFTVIRTH